MTKTKNLTEKLLSQSTDPDAYHLIEALIAAAREEAIEDIKIDLADFDQTEAVEIIKANY